MGGRRGIFVAVDGPKRSGKSTVVGELARRLVDAGVSVLVTKEPTSRFDLAEEERRAGVELARLLADDRRWHLNEVVTPGVARYDVVVTDRYIASSLVFQVLDGVPFETVWSLNEAFLLPDINIFLTVDPGSADRRLRRRGIATRFDKSLRTIDEAARYDIARLFLAGLGVTVAQLSNGDDTPVGTAVDSMAQLITKHLGNHV